MGKVCKRDGKKERFDERKLYASVYYPAREQGYETEDAEELAAEISETVRDWVVNHEDTVLTANEIKRKTKELLEDQDEDVAFMYETHLDLS